MAVDQDYILARCTEADMGYETPCWVWDLTPNDSGYGTLNGTSAHRVAYGLWRGSIENQLDHLCEVRACVNPWHLEDVTASENVRRARARRTHCPKGHLQDEATIYINPRGERSCRTCNRERSRDWARSHRLQGANT